MPKRDRQDDTPLPGKRQRVDEPAMTDFAPPPSIARGSRRYIPVSSASNRSFRRGRRYAYPRYGFIPRRGISALVNRYGLPEKKSIEVQRRYMPIRMGDTTGTLSWDAAALSIFTTFNGTNTAGVVDCINAVGSGTLINERIGRKINIKSCLMQVIWRLGPTVTEGTIPVAIRTMLVWDKQPTGVLPTASQILLPLTHVGNDYAQPHSPNNLNFRDRFRVLYDWRSTLTPGGQSVQTIDKFIKIVGETIYGSAGATIGDITSGSLLFLSTSDAPVANPQTSSNTPFVTYITRVRYTDC